MIQVEEIDGVVKMKMAKTLIMGRPFYFTTAYWVDGLLIDTGCYHTRGELICAIEGLAINKVVNTHSHEDHIGANGALQEKYGLEILAHPLALPILADPRRLRLQLYRRVFWGRPQPSTGQAIGEVVETEHHRFQVIHTPGHSDDHICLYEPDEGWLFSGDAYIGGRDSTLRADYDIYAIIASLKKMAALPLRRLFPASGTVRDSPASALTQKIAYLEELGGRIRRLHEEGRTISQIRDEVLGREGMLFYITGGHFSGMNLVRSYLSHGRGNPCHR
jgi:glyoxylase-like metal-dependent hydrolase (beta-lactamase superfamily II)